MSRLGFRKAAGVIVVVILAAWMLAGCSNRAESAQKLFDRGQYQLVVEKYPDLEIAQRSRAKLADQLLEKKDYETILRDYRDTPAAYKALSGMAQKLYDAGRYQDVIDQYPSLPVANMAKERMADSLYAMGKIDEVVQRFADTQKGKTAKEERAAQALVEAKKLRGQARIDALTKLLNTYGGTASFTEANQLLTKANQAKAPKPKK